MFSDHLGDNHLAMKNLLIGSISRFGHIVFSWYDYMTINLNAMFHLSDGSSRLYLSPESSAGNFPNGANLIYLLKCSVKN